MTMKYSYFCLYFFPLGFCSVAMGFHLLALTSQELTHYVY